MDASHDSQAVLAKLMDDGTFDKLRHQALQELRQHAGLREKAQQLIQQSRAYASKDKDALERNRKKVFAEIKAELEDKMLEEATKSMWEVITDEQFSISQQIEKAVQEALCSTYETQRQQQRAGQ